MSDPGGETIRSSDNRTLKVVRSLRLRNVREAERAFLVEGVRAVDDALLAGGVARLVLVRAGSDWSPPIGSMAKSVRWVSPELFNTLTDTVTPQPLLAVMEMPPRSLPETRSPLSLVIDGVRDPGNLGTLIRSAAGAGVDAVFWSEGTVDPYNAKAVRAGMGAHFRVSIHPYDEKAQEWVQECGSRIVVAGAEAGDDYAAFDWRGAVCLVIGGEAEGPARLWSAVASARVNIPLHNGVESLNAGVAGSILLFEAARQRETTSAGE